MLELRQIFKLAIPCSILFLTGTFAARDVRAQGKMIAPTSKVEFVEKCKEISSDPIKFPKFATKELLQLLKALETETDPEVKKGLEGKKKVELDNFLEKTEQNCEKLFNKMFEVR